MIGMLSLSLATLAMQMATLPRVAGSSDAHVARIDVNHSTLDFSVRHFGVTRIRGVFNEWSGTIVWNDADLTKSSVAVVVQTASVDTRNNRRDGDLRSDNFFDAERYPAIVLRSTGIETAGDGYVMHANLTIRDLTKEVIIPFEFLGEQEVRGRRIFAAGSFTIKRSEWNLARENRLAQALSVVSDEVELELEIEGVVSDLGAAPFNSRGKPSIGETLLPVVQAKGADAALALYDDLTTTKAEDYNFDEREMLVLAYRLLSDGNRDAANKIGAHMVAASPGPDWHVFLAQSALSASDTGGARQHLDHALAADPLNTTALALQQMLQ
jgi:polyisoprenoid-binding protein YceI